MPLMPPNSTAWPRPVYIPPRPDQYKKPAYPVDGTPVKASTPGRLSRSPAYQHHAMEIPDLQDGFAPTLQPDFADPPGSPDPIRMNRREPPPTTYEPERSVHRGVDFLRRLSVETQHSTGWRVEQDWDQVPLDPSRVAMAQDKLPTRPTAVMGQNTYLHLRGDFPERPPYCTGEHFSFADHRRLNLIMGQRPRDRMGVNTYRKEPAPWDSGLQVLPETEGARTAIAVGRLSGNRSYRARGGTNG